MSTPFIATYEDVIDRLGDWLRGRNVAAGGARQEVVRQAVEASLRAIANERDWSAFKRHYRIALDGVYNTGTIAYDSSTYTVTLTGGTWPSWAAQGELYAGSVISDVDTRVSDTVLTLKSPRVPTADIDAGSSYTLGRSWYILPPEFAGAWTPSEKTAWFIGRHVTLDEIHMLRKYRAISGTVQKWAIGPAPDYYGSMALYVHPWASSDSAEDFVAKFRPRDLTVSGKETWNSQGTVSCTADSTAVTGDSTDFRSAMEGAIIRFSSGSTAPTSQTGNNPYVFQQSITSVTTTTGLTLSAAASSTLSDVDYRVSDPVDMPAYLFDVFVARCKMQLAYDCGMDWPQNMKTHYQTALTEAKKADSFNRQPRQAGIRTRYRGRLADYKTRPWEGA